EVANAATDAPGVLKLDARRDGGIVCERNCGEGYSENGNREIAVYAVARTVLRLVGVEIEVTKRADDEVADPLVVASLDRSKAMPIVVARSGMSERLTDDGNQGRRDDEDVEVIVIGGIDVEIDICLGGTTTDRYAEAGPTGRVCGRDRSGQTEGSCANSA